MRGNPRKMWCDDSKSYINGFKERLKDSFDKMLSEFSNTVNKDLAEKDDPVDVVAGLAINSSFLNYELSLKMADHYINEKYLEYALYRGLVHEMSKKIMDWLSIVDEIDGGDWGFVGLCTDMLIDVELPIAISLKDEAALKIYQRLIEGYDTSDAFSFTPELTQEFRVMVNWGLGLEEISSLVRFEPDQISDYLQFRYKRCFSRKHSVSHAFALVPEELIAYYGFHGNSIPNSLADDTHFSAIQGALDVISSGEKAAFDSDRLCSVLKDMINLEQITLDTLGKSSDILLNKSLEQ
jgi:hypothetical protein